MTTKIEHVTLVNPSCRLGCKHCGYPNYSPVDESKIVEIIKNLQAKRHTVKLYDMDISSQSLRLFELTKQYEDPKGFGWLNVTENFKPNRSELSKLEKMMVGFCLSLHGPSADISSMISGSKDRHARLLESFGYLRSNLPDKPVGLAMVVHKHNIEYIKEMILLGNKLDVGFLEFINILFAGRATSNLTRDFFLEKTDLTKALMDIKKYSALANYEIQLDSTWGPSTSIIPPVTVIPQAGQGNCSMFAPSLKNRFCNAGYNHVGIRLDNLLVFPCPGMTVYKELAIGKYIDGDIKIEDNWIRTYHTEPCNSCDIYTNCLGGCRISSIAEGLRLFGAIKRNIGQNNCAYHVTRGAR